MSDPVLHIDLRNWAHVILIAPLSANSLAKLSNGICDNLLTCILRATPSVATPLSLSPSSESSLASHSVVRNPNSLLHAYSHPAFQPPIPLPCYLVPKPILVAPAMNSAMWYHPLTEKHIISIQRDQGYLVIYPVSKTLACGDVGMGAMAHVETLVDVVEETFASLTASASSLL